MRVRRARGPAHCCPSRCIACPLRPQNARAASTAVSARAALFNPRLCPCACAGEDVLSWLSFGHTSIAKKLGSEGRILAFYYYLTYCILKVRGRSISDARGRSVSDVRPPRFVLMACMLPA